MTAEIIVVNKNAIAIATDSAVTANNPYGAPKIYNTVNKLFNLSGNVPVALMVYGNAEFIGLPWETIVKTYRKRIANSTFPTIEEYSRDFIAYLDTLELPRSDDIAAFEAFIYNSYDSLSHQVLAGIRSMEVEGVVNEKNFPLCVEKIVRQKQEQINKVETVDGFDDLTFAQIVRQYGRMIRRAINEVIQERYGLPVTRPCRRHLWEIAYLLVIKKVPSPIHSGLVVAGFGEQQMLPSIRCFMIDGRFCDKLKYVLNGKNDVTRENAGAIMPFAQQEMVYRFMEGVDGDYQQYVEGLVQTILLSLPAVFATKYVRRKKDRVSIVEQLTSTIKSSINEISKDLQAYRRETFVDPIINAVRILPKDELARLAESLVQLTSLKRRMSMELETVGEPIDVAIISKGDGFVWIKRKHYFEGKLNPGFFAKYNQPMEARTEEGHATATSPERDSS